MNWKERYANDNLINFDDERQKRGLPLEPPTEPTRRQRAKQTFMDYLEFMGLKSPTK